MKSHSTIQWATALLLSSCIHLNAADTDGFKPLFNGKDLKHWDGNPQFWSVRDGAITGQTTKEKPTKGNTFIIWRGGTVANFELKLKYKIVGGNSGIQYVARTWAIGWQVAIKAIWRRAIRIQAFFMKRKDAASWLSVGK